MSDTSQNDVVKTTSESSIKKSDDGLVCKNSSDVESHSVDERGQWGSSAEFILSCLGYAVGLGNVWRFPYLCYVNGGGAFLIPYVIMMIFVGLPVFLIELTVAQYSGKGPLHIWDVSPIFQGVGAGMLMISFISNIYYNMLLAWALYYMFASWQTTVPWSSCTHDYNTINCYQKKEARPCESTPGNVWFNQTCYNNTDINLDYNSTWWVGEACDNVTMTSQCYNSTILNQFNGTHWINETCLVRVDNTSVTVPPVGGVNVSSCVNFVSNGMRQYLDGVAHQRISASEEYFNWNVLDRSPSIDEPGVTKWDLVLVLLAAWIICGACIVKGIKTSGKVVYFTAIFPYVMLVILVIRGCLLPGAIDGIKFYIVPDFSKLASPKVWADAAGQVFFSLSCGMGGLMTFASYNKFNNNIYRDTLIVVISDGLTSIFSGFAIFSILGYLALSLGREVQDVITSGSGLAFIAYPEVTTFIEPPQLWATFFFIMLITLGIDSQTAGIEALFSATLDSAPKLRRYKPLVCVVHCSIQFILGLSMCTQAGVYWLELMSYYSTGWSLILIALAETIVFPWIYGARRLLKDIEEMVGFRLYMHWWFCMKFITPALLLAILIFNITDNTPLAYGDYVLPDWSQAVGWLMAVASVGLIPIFAVFQIWRSYRLPEYDGLNFGRRLIKLTQPTSAWKRQTDHGSTSATGGPATVSPMPLGGTEFSTFEHNNNTSLSHDKNTNETMKSNGIEHKDSTLDNV